MEVANGIIRLVYNNVCQQTLHTCMEIALFFITTVQSAKRNDHSVSDDSVNLKYFFKPYS